MLRWTAQTVFSSPRRPWPKPWWSPGFANIGAEMQQLMEELGCEVSPVTEAFAARVARAYARWGKGVQPAGLNFGDCFAYALAEERRLPLLFVGDGFMQTDVLNALLRA